MWDRTGLVLAATAYRDNADLIYAAARLGHLRPHWWVLDVSYGQGTFWRRWQPETLTTNDLYEPGADYQHDYRRLLPWVDGTFDAVVLDPPYGLRGTVDKARWENGGYGLDNGYKPVNEILGDVRLAIGQCARLIRPDGRFLLKCQDQVALQRIWWQTIEFTNHAARYGLTLVEKLDMLPKTKGGRKQPDRTRKARKGEPHDGTGRVPSTQQHARGRPSSLLIFRKEAPPDA